MHFSSPLVAMAAAALFLPVALAMPATVAGTPADSINKLGIELHQLAPQGNFLISPFSIQSALAMTSAGAAGRTLEEMRAVLHVEGEESALHGALQGLFAEFKKIAADSQARAERSKESGGQGSPLELRVANRLFGQKDFIFKRPFLDLVRDQYAAPLESVDFEGALETSRLKINAWVEEQTGSKIRDLIGPTDLERATRLVLVNALYFRASWSEPFQKSATQPAPFLLEPGHRVDVPTMALTSRLGYARRDGFQSVTLPYEGGGFQFLILLPDPEVTLAQLESRLTPALLAEAAGSARAKVALFLPKFRIQPPTVDLAEGLKKLGMRTAFDEPRRSANFERMAERKPDEYLFIGKVLHKTFLDLDENGTEAAAATAVGMTKATSMPAPENPPVEVRVDRPFLFAVQHRSSGVCLFLGRVTDPR
jgi:serpin B